MKIDLVYLWVDGNDPEWRAKKNSYLPDEEVQRADDQTFCKGRFENNDELKYSLRSVELYAPWINHIFIVTDNQTPAWLETSNKKVTVVDHSEILPADKLPIFNSTAIEMGLVNIPNLSEHFLCANDDMLFNDRVSEDFFYTKSGKAIYRVKRSDRFFKELKRKLSGKPPKVETTCAKKQTRAAKMILRDFKKDFTKYTNSHNIDAYIKSSMCECIERYKESVEFTISSRFRSEYDLQRYIFSMYAVATGGAICKVRGLFAHNFIKLRFAKLFVHIDWLLLPMKHKDGLKKIKEMNPSLLCINDGNGVTDEDRDRAKEVLKALFPNKSAFEK